MKVKLSRSELEILSKEVRRGVFLIAQNAKSGHIGGCSSSVELMTGLYFGGALNYNPSNPFEENRDRVLVRGHLGPLRYKLFSTLGWIDPKELDNYRKLNSLLEGHEDMDLVPGVDITPSGSLGMLLSYGVGASVAAKRIGKNFLNYVFLGDGEEQEGNVSEAARHASSKGLDNLIVIIDKNGKQLSHSTSYSDSESDVRKIWEGYGWKTFELENGHDFDQIRKAYSWARKADRPALIIANTVKGKGMERCNTHYSGYHTIGTADPSLVQKAIEQLELETDKGALEKILSKIPSCKNLPEIPKRNFSSPAVSLSPSKKEFKNLLGGLVDYLSQLSKDFEKRKENLYVITPDLIREDIISVLGLDNPSVDFHDVGIREQHATAMAHGIINTDQTSKVLLDVGEEFLYRNADQLNVLAQSKSPVVVLGNMGGICGAKNGKTHQPTGQSGMLTLMSGMRCLEPSDIRDLFTTLNEGLSNRISPTYVRMHSGPLPSIGREQRDCKFYIARDCKNPQVTLVSNGLTLRGTLDASEVLSVNGIQSRVINVIDRGSLDERFVRMVKPGRPIVTIYNGNPDSLSHPVSDALMKSKSKRPSKLISHGFRLGTSGDLPDLVKHFRFDDKGISEIVKEVLNES